MFNQKTINVHFHDPTGQEQGPGNIVVRCHPSRSCNNFYATTK